MTSRKHKSQPGFTRGPRIADLMTHEYERFVQSSIAAERVGDAETALEYHLGVPMFTHSRHAYTLKQLAGLSEEMTPWLWARWAAYQCTRAEDPATESGFITRAALDYTLRVFYDDQMQEAYEDGRDPVKLAMRVMGESWIYHQLCTFELGGLREFLDFVADDDLIANADWARSWEHAPMRGVRVEQPAPGRLVVADLATREEIEVLDLGAGLLTEEGGFLVGRLVPSGVTPATMFDSTPIAVDRKTAQQVARSIDGGWITALTRAIAQGRLILPDLESEDRELASDIPSTLMIEAATPVAARARLRSEQDDGRDVIGRAAFRILRDASLDTLGDDDKAPYVAAAVLNPHAYEDARRKLIVPGRPTSWMRWADLATEPARSRLQHLADSASRSAA